VAGETRIRTLVQELGGDALVDAELEQANSRVFALSSER
jgi:hypothetical protein